MVESARRLLLCPKIFSDSEKITFVLLKSLPHVRSWWEGYWERYTMDESTLFGREPTWVAFVDALKEEFYPVETMMTNT
jgi:hypothetical protein